MTPRRAGPNEDWEAILALLHGAFAYMEGRIDPPSSLHRLTAAGVAAQAASGEVWLVDADGHPCACLFLTPQPDALYLGKLAVATAHRGRGLARALIGAAETSGDTLGLPRLRALSRVELTEVHAALTAMGFEVTGESAHQGYDRPTSLTFTKTLEPER